MKVWWGESMSRSQGDKVAEVLAVATLRGKKVAAYVCAASLSDGGNVRFTMQCAPLFWRHPVDRVLLVTPNVPFDGRVLELQTKFGPNPCGYALAKGDDRHVCRIARVYTTKDAKPRLRVPLEVWPFFWEDSTDRRVVLVLDGQNPDE